MAQIITLNPDRRAPIKNPNGPIRACGSCVHRPRAGNYGMCRATQSLAESERRGMRDMCGPEGKMWEPQKGVVRRMINWLW